MRKLHTYMLATACAVFGAATMSTSASAVTCNGDPNCSLGLSPYTFGASDVFGGGSSLVAPYWRQASDCYGSPADLITRGSPASYVDEALFNYAVGKHAQNCATKEIDPSVTTWYISTGSGIGILDVFSHDPSTFNGNVNSQNPKTFPEEFYSLSDAGLDDSQVGPSGIYNVGGMETQSGFTITIEAPGAIQCNQGSTNDYPNPLQCYGPIIQFPFSIDPVVDFYTNGGVYEKIAGTGKAEKDYALNVQNKTTSGGLRLSANSLCGIWTGNITDWNDPSLTADNGGVSLKSTVDPTPVGSWSVPLIPVGRSDGSGTTFIMSRHMSAICSGTQYTQGATTLPSAYRGNTYTTSNSNYPGVDISGKITVAPNSSGVAQYVAFTTAPAGLGNQCSAGTKLPSGYKDCIQQSRLGYIGADYVKPFVKNSHTNNYNLQGATLQNSSGNWIAPSQSAALAAFNGISPPSTQSAASDPANWVEGPASTVPLANPTDPTAFPQVGTTNYLGYTCYANSGPKGTIVGQLNYVETATINTSLTKGVLGLSGLAPLPSAWRNAIVNDFVTNNSGFNLEISTAGKANCSGSSIVGG